MIEALGWFFQNVGLAFYNFAYAVTHPGQWLNWSDPEAIMRTVYYGGSVEFFFVFFNAFVILTLVGLWRQDFMWRCVYGLEGFANTIGRVVAWAGLIMVLQQLLIVFTQRIFAVAEISLGFGAVMTFDVSWWSEGLKLYNAMVVALCVSYTYVQGGHVRVDILYANFSHRTRKIIDIMGATIFMAPMGVLIWLYAWYFMWRHLILPAPSASSQLDQLLARAQIMRWNVETTGFSPNGFSAYFLFKVLLVMLAGLILLHAAAVIWRAIAEIRAGEESENQGIDRDRLDDEAEDLQHDIHSGAT